MNDFLYSIDFTTYYNLDNVESAWQFIKSALLDAAKRFIPTFSLKHNSLPKWFTSNLRHRLKCIHTLRRRYRKSPSDHINNRLKFSLLKSVY